MSENRNTDFLLPETAEFFKILITFNLDKYDEV